MKTSMKGKHRFAGHVPYLRDNRWAIRALVRTPSQWGKKKLEGGQKKDGATI